MYNHDMKKNTSLLIAILLVAATLRAPITVLGPIAGIVRESLGVSNAVMGLLTTIPLLMFAVVSPAAGVCGVRFGIGRVIGLSLGGILIGLLIRSYTGMAGLFAGTMCIGVAMTFGNVLLPSVIKSEMPERAGLCTGLFSVTMCVFSAIAAGLSIPLCVGLGLGWRHTLAISGVLVIAAIAAWLPHHRMKLVPVEASTANGQTSVWRSGEAWWLAGFMAAQSVIFYFFVAWLPSIVQSYGVTQSVSGAMATVYQFGSIAGTLLAPNLASRKGARKMVIRGVSALYVLGILLFLLAKSSGLIWTAVVLCGVCTGASFSIVLLLLALRSSDSGRAARLSGMVQAAGYTAAAIFPTLAGYLFDVTGTWRIPLLFPLLITFFMLLSGGKVGEEKVI